MRNPGIHNLLRAGDMDLDDTVTSCQNALLPILSGMEAIGDWMTQNTEHVGLADGTLANTGYLLRFLAGLALDLHHIEEDAQFKRRESGNQPRSETRRAA
jgi:hypothetical protein